MNYVPLRVKTSYNILTSLINIKELVSYCKSLGIKSIGVCDTSLFYVMEFYNECIKNDIKPIIGLDISNDDELLLLYAKNYEGYQNLCRIYYRLSNLSLDILKEYSSDLICVTDNITKYNDIYSDIYKGSIKPSSDVYVNNIYCLYKDDIKYLKYLYLIKGNKKINDTLGIKINSNCYIETIDKEYKLEREIASKCNIKFKSDKSLMPKYKDNSKELLFNLCKVGLNKRFNNLVTKKYYDRLLYELSVIDKMGYNDYFLVVLDFIRYAKNNNIFVGPGRGSAASSLVAYSLGITEIDPIKYDLLFERFLNIERITMPDIDTDFDADKKDMVIDYVKKKYGELCVSPIITFSTLSFKQALRDVGRIYDIDMSLIDKLNKLIEKDIPKDELMSFIKFNNLEDIYNISLKLDGLKRNISINAAGIIISSKELDSYIPLYNYNNNYVCGFTKDYIESLGILKMDFLSIKHLSYITSIVNEIGINYSDIDINDINALNILRNGLSTGIFQFESPGMKRFLKNINITSIDDVIIAISLYRPGPMKMIDTFINRKNNKEKITYLDSSLESILKSTYGIIVYQEQILMIANKICNYSYSEADLLRRAISKKNNNIILKEKDKFVKKGIENGHSEEVVEKIYDYIIPFSEYGFNKSHAVCYTYFALMECYLKANYSINYMKLLLNNEIGNNTKIKELVDECKILNVYVDKPNINISMDNFIIKDNKIIYSLSSIIGNIKSSKIIDNRGNGFIDIYDFINKCYSFLDKKDIINLIYTGAFDSFNINKSTLINNLDTLINYAELGLKEDKPILKEYDEYDNMYLLNKELEVFGYYFSNHPTSTYKLKNNSVDICNIDKYLSKNINVVGLVERVKIITTKNNEEMCFIDIIDDTGSISVTVFPSIYKNISIKKDDIIYINAKVNRRNGIYNLELVKINN